MASPGSGTLKLGKQCVNNTLADSRTAKNCCAHVVGRPNDNHDSGGSTTKEDSEAERDKVQRCLLRPVTPNPTAYQHWHCASRAAAIAIMRGWASVRHGRCRHAMRCCRGRGRCAACCRGCSRHTTCGVVVTVVVPCCVAVVAVVILHGAVAVIIVITSSHPRGCT